MTPPRREPSSPGLVALAQNGDDEAFAALVRRNQVWVRTLLYRMSADASLADDLAQDAFLTAWRRLGQLAAPAAFDGWLRRIAVNHFLAHVRRPGTGLSLGDEHLDQMVAPHADPALRLDLDRALTTLSPGERVCLVLNYGEGLSHGEIADLTGLALGTIKSHVRRAGGKVRSLLGEVAHV